MILKARTMPLYGCFDSEEHVYGKWYSHRWRKCPTTEPFSAYVCLDCKSTYSSTTSTFVKTEALVEAETIAQLQHELKQ